MRVFPLQADEERWPDFLKGSTHDIYHTPDYMIFAAEAFKTKVVYWAAEEEGKLCALLPVFEVKSVLFGSRLISTAFLEYGGACGEGRAVEMILDFLRQEFSGGCGYLEIRGGRENLESSLGGSLVRRSEYKRFLLELGDEADIWKEVQREKRKSVRNAWKTGIKISEVPGEEISPLYDLYCRNMRAFGSPPFPISYFRSFFSHMVERGLGKIFGAYLDDRLIAMLSGFLYGDRIHIVISVSDKRFLHCRPNDALHWHFIKYGCENGFLIFDFGRAREDSGQFAYKKKWGARASDLDHFYLLWKKDVPPHIDPENPKYRFVTGIWRKLPLPVTKLIGPWIREGLGI